MNKFQEVHRFFPSYFPFWFNVHMTKMQPNVLFISRDHRESWRPKELARLCKSAARQKLLISEHPSDSDDFFMVAKPKGMPDCFVVDNRLYDIGTFLLDYTCLDLPFTETMVRGKQTSGGYALNILLHWDGMQLWGRTESWPKAIKALKKAKTSVVKTWLLDEGNLGNWVPIEKLMKVE